MGDTGFLGDANDFSTENSKSVKISSGISSGVILPMNNISRPIFRLFSFSNASSTEDLMSFKLLDKIRKSLSSLKLELMLDSFLLYNV